MVKIISTMLIALSISAPQVALSQANKLSFFVTSVGLGKGADLGGLAGADAHCSRLATAAGAGQRSWKAYLSVVALAGQAQVNARDRIGTGPWHNANGVLVAHNVDDLHSDKNKLNKENSISETGAVIKGRGDQPNRHDMLTGSLLDGSASTSKVDTTCNNWSSSSGEGSALLGHHDRQGGNDRTSWNSAHDSLGCSQKNLQGTGGDGLFYCFAAD